MTKRNEILANRRKWIEFLKQDYIQKAQGVLNEVSKTGKEEDEARCCLGHGCYALGIKRREYTTYAGYYLYGLKEEGGYPPPEFVELVGLYSRTGSTQSGVPFADNHDGHRKIDSLSRWNDNTLVMPQEIGAYLETVIEGGPDTPFKPLSDFEE